MTVLLFAVLIFSIWGIVASLRPTRYYCWRDGVEMVYDKRAECYRCRLCGSRKYVP